MCIVVPLDYNDTVRDCYTGAIARVVIPDGTCLDPGFIEVEYEVTGQQKVAHRDCYEPAYGPRRDVGWGRTWWWDVLGQAVRKTPEGWEP